MLKQIPIALNEPVFVIKSATRNDSIVVFTDIKDNKRPNSFRPLTGIIFFYPCCADQHYWL